VLISESALAPAATPRRAGRQNNVGDVRRELHNYGMVAASITPARVMRSPNYSGTWQRQNPCRVHSCRADSRMFQLDAVRAGCLRCVRQSLARLRALESTIADTMTARSGHARLNFRGDFTQVDFDGAGPRLAQRLLMATYAGGRSPCSVAVGNIQHRSADGLSKPRRPSLLQNAL